MSLRWCLVVRDYRPALLGFNKLCLAHRARYMRRFGHQAPQPKINDKAR
jgi:hypothetical protein